MRFLKQSQAEEQPQVGQVHRSFHLRNFVAHVRRVAHPNILDLGHLDGDNIAFFATRGCKVYVLDLLAELEEQLAQAAGAGGPPFGELRHFPPGFFHGILCWDLFDVLHASNARILAARIDAILKLAGALFCLFRSDAASSGWEPFKGYRIHTEGELIYREQAHRGCLRHTYSPRAIQQLFPCYELVNPYLLKSGMHEVLLVKRGSGE